MTAKMMTIETKSLGDRSYLVHDGQVAVVIDPQRDIDRVLELANAEGVRITHVFETHIHNDYVTGGLALSEATGAAYVVAAGDPVPYHRVPASDGSRFTAGGLSVTAIATPGHTPTHLAYALAEGDGPPIAVFTGGSMLFGAVGRTDLISPERTIELTHAQYHSVRRLASELPVDTQVLPTHGFGSFCAATPTSGDSSSIGAERTSNIALTAEDEETFVATLVAGLGAFPRYYAHMGPANLGGPGAPNLDPPQPVDADQLRKRIDAGEWVVDLRQRRAFAHEHITGTISVELGDSFVTFLGWTMTWGAPLSLIGDSAEQVAEAQRQLVRIGVDRLAGAATGSTTDLAQGRMSSYRVATFDEVGAAIEDGAAVLDVRRPDEWEQGHLATAIHIPFWELEGRVDELPDAEIWVHCASGFRASISTSLLDRAGKRAVHVDDDWSRAGELGLAMSD